MRIQETSDFFQGFHQSSSDPNLCVVGEEAAFRDSTRELS